MNNRLISGDDNGYRSKVTHELIVIIIFQLAHKLADTAMSQ